MIKNISSFSAERVASHLKYLLLFSPFASYPALPSSIHPQEGPSSVPQCQLLPWWPAVYFIFPSACVFLCLIHTTDSSASTLCCNTRCTSLWAPTVAECHLFRVRKIKAQKVNSFPPGSAEMDKTVTFKKNTGLLLLLYWRHCFSSVARRYYTNL